MRIKLSTVPISVQSWSRRMAAGSGRRWRWTNQSWKMKVSSVAVVSLAAALAHVMWLSLVSYHIEKMIIITMSNGQLSTNYELIIVCLAFMWIHDETLPAWQIHACNFLLYYHGCYGYTTTVWKSTHSKLLPLNKCLQIRSEKNLQLTKKKFCSFLSISCLPESTKVENFRKLHQFHSCMYLQWRHSMIVYVVMCNTIQ